MLWSWADIHCLRSHYDSSSLWCSSLLSLLWTWRRRRSGSQFLHWWISFCSRFSALSASIDLSASSVRLVLCGFVVLVRSFSWVVMAPVHAVCYSCGGGSDSGRSCAGALYWSIWPLALQLIAGDSLSLPLSWQCRWA